MANTTSLTRTDAVIEQPELPRRSFFQGRQIRFTFFNWIRLILLFAIIFSARESTAYCAPPKTLVPNVLSTDTAADWNKRFEGKEGWIGGDGAYSVAISPKRVIWLFGDTLLGSVKEGRRAGAAMVNNTVGVQEGLEKDSVIRFISGKPKEGKPTAFLTPADAQGWFWPLAVAYAGGRLFLFLQQIDKTNDPGVFGFKQIGLWLAVIENPADDPEKWQVKQYKVPHADLGGNRNLSWGSALLPVGDYIYVYGFAEGPDKTIGKRQLTVARVPADKLDDFKKWEFRSKSGWSNQASDALELADGMATEFSVTRNPVGNGFVIVCTENGLSDRIIARFANEPDGPWSEKILLYKCPEMGTDKGVFSYSAKAHGWAAAGNELIISYCVNAWDFGRLFKEDKVYRPKFARVVLSPPK